VETRGPCARRYRRAFTQKQKNTVCFVYADRIDVHAFGRIKDRR
jgi:hypothetical protein